MRGVSGLELEILRAKAGGMSVPCADGTAAYDAHMSLMERGLIAISSWREDEWVYTDITAIGRVVLAASMQAVQA